jgi:hypothetical protein
MPVLYCYRPEVCIIGIKARNGNWQSRVFGFYVSGEFERINLARIYGDGLYIKDIVEKVNLKRGSLGLNKQLRFSETCGDVYFPLP